MYKEHPLLNAAFVWFRATFMGSFSYELTINECFVHFSWFWCLKRDRKKQKGKNKEDLILAFLTMRYSWVTAGVDGSWEHFSSPEQALVRNSDEWFLIHVPWKSVRVKETILSFLTGVPRMPVYLFTWENVCLSILPLVWLSVYLSICKSINVSDWVWMSVCLFVSLSVCLSESANLFDRVWLSVYRSIGKSICLSVYL